MDHTLSRVCVCTKKLLHVIVFCVILQLSSVLIHFQFLTMYTILIVLDNK